MMYKWTTDVLYGRAIKLKASLHELEMKIARTTSPGTYVIKTQILQHHGNSALTPTELAIKAPIGDHHLLLTNF